MEDPRDRVADRFHSGGALERTGIKVGTPGNNAPNLPSNLVCTQITAKLTTGFRKSGRWCLSQVRR